MKNLLSSLFIVFLFGLTSWKGQHAKGSIESISSELVSEVAKDNIGSLLITILSNDSISYFRSHAQSVVD